MRGVSDGIRTRDRLDHNWACDQPSYESNMPICSRFPSSPKLCRFLPICVDKQGYVGDSGTLGEKCLKSANAV